MSRSIARSLFPAILCLFLAPTADVVAAEAIDGEWELSLAKSKFDPGPPPKSSSRTYRTEGDLQTVAIKSVSADGQALASRASYRLDGKDHPVTGSSNDIDAVAWTKVDDRTARGVLKRAGKVAVQMRRELSADGKTLTISQQGMTRDGRPLNDVLVFDRK